MAQIQMNSLADLERWLIKNQINYKYWGVGQSKTVENLFEEITKGESGLQNNPPVRVLSVVQVIIRQGNKVLVEKEQFLSDGRTRARSLPPSEKMHAGEGWRLGAIRCLEEELQINSVYTKILTEMCVARIKEGESVSYPGLRSSYHIFQVEALIPNLPDRDFFTNEKLDPQADHLVSKHKWGWVPFESLNVLLEKGFGKENE